MPHSPTVEQLVANLPEVYQPIFGHSRLSRNAARSCLDRLAHIRRIYAAYSKCLGRPVRVLDIGCAQGFFSLHLAEAGAEVVGVDILEANVRLCNALRGKSNVTFKAMGIEDFLPEIAPGQFDLFLGLSVFHHLCNSWGFDRTRVLVSTLAERISVGVFELASAEEPLSWAQSLPTNELSVLSAFSFIHTLERIPTHLSAVKRPLIVASSKFWLLGDDCGRIEDSITESHQFARGTHEQSRRYFRGNGLFIKLFSLEGNRGDINRLELTHEAEFLSSPPAAFVPAPRLHAWNLGPREGWLVREEISGQLLSDIQARGGDYDAPRIIRDVLVQLAALEAVGLYHNDIRIWNTLVLENGDATLIDYGAIAATPVDCVYREHPVLSFFSYLEEVVSGKFTTNQLLRFPYTVPSRLDFPFVRWVNRIWAHPLEKWSYKLFLQALTDSEKGKDDKRMPESVGSTNKVAYLERYLASYATRMAEASAALDVAASHQSDRQKIVESQESELMDRAGQITRLTELTRQHEAESVARMEQIHVLTELALRHEAESADRGRQVEQLTTALQASQADALARMEQIHTLTELALRHEAESAARAVQIETLTTLARDQQQSALRHAEQVQHLETTVAALQDMATARARQRDELIEALRQSQIETSLAARLLGQVATLPVSAPARWVQLPPFALGGTSPSAVRFLLDVSEIGPHRVIISGWGFAAAENASPTDYPCLLLPGPGALWLLRGTGVERPDVDAAYPAEGTAAARQRAGFLFEFQTSEMPVPALRDLRIVCGQVAGELVMSPPITLP